MMRGKTWVFMILVCFVSLLTAVLGCSSAPVKTGPVGDTITVSFDKAGAAPELKINKKIAFADTEADLEWLRQEGQDFTFQVFFPKDSPFDAALGKKLKSKDQTDAKKGHGIKEKVRKDAPEGCYHYIVAAYIDGEVYIIDPEIIVPRPGR